MTNNAQVTIGSVQDPLQISSEDQFSVRDSISIPIKSQVLLLGIEHDRVQPSLVSKLNQELGLLSPALQAEFQSNLSAFVDSSNFPPEVKAILAAEQPTGTIFQPQASISVGTRLHVSPNFSVTHSRNGSQSEAWTQSFGFLQLPVEATLQFRSSLSNVLLWDSRQNNPHSHARAFGGFRRALRRCLALCVAASQPDHEGRVFRDNNIQR